MDARAPLIAVLLLAAAGTPAMAAPSWQAPERIAGAGGDATPAVDDEGNTLVLFSHAPLNASALGVSFRPRGGTFGAVDTLPAHGAALQLAFSDAGEAVAAWDSHREESNTSVLQTAVRPPGGGFGQIQELGLGGVPHLALAPDGSAVVAWIRGDSVVASYRPAGGRFGSERILTEDNALVDHVAAGIDATGTATVAWTRYETRDDPNNGLPCAPVPPGFGCIDVHMLETVRRPAGGDWEEVQRYGDYTGLGELAVDSGGEALLYWGKSPDKAYLSRRAPGEPRFGEPRDAPAFETGERRASLDIFHGPRGHALAALVTDGGVWRFTRPDGGEFGPGQKVGTGRGDLAHDHEGDIAVVVGRGEGSPSLLLQHAPFGETLGPVETVTGPGPAGPRRLTLGPAASAALAWNVSGDAPGVYAAVREEASKPDTAAPLVTLARLSRRPRTMILRMRCSEDCTVRPSARLRWRGGSARAGGRAVTLPERVLAGVKVRLPRAAVRALGRGTRVRADLTLTARDSAGNERRIRRALFLRG